MKFFCVKPPSPSEYDGIVTASFTHFVPLCLKKWLSAGELIVVSVNAVNVVTPPPAVAPASIASNLFFKVVVKFFCVKPPSPSEYDGIATVAFTHLLVLLLYLKNWLFARVPISVSVNSFNPPPVSSKSSSSNKSPGFFTSNPASLAISTHSTNVKFLESAVAVVVVVPFLMVRLNLDILLESLIAVNVALAPPIFEIPALP